MSDVPSQYRTSLHSGGALCLPVPRARPRSCATLAYRRCHEPPNEGRKALKRYEPWASRETSPRPFSELLDAGHPGRRPQEGTSSQATGPIRVARRTPARDTLSRAAPSPVAGLSSGRCFGEDRRNAGPDIPPGPVRLRHRWTGKTDSGAAATSLGQIWGPCRGGDDEGRRVARAAHPPTGHEVPEPSGILHRSPSGRLAGISRLRLAAMRPCDWPRGPTTKRIQSTFIDTIHGRVESYADWLTFVDA